MVYIAGDILHKNMLLLRAWKEAPWMVVMTVLKVFPSASLV
jgi:hypothetical protein